MKEGWEYKKLGEICRVINGRAYSKDEMLNKGKYRLLRVGNFFTNDSWYYSDLELEEDKYCDNGDLLYAWSASFGPRIWDGEKVIYHYHIWKMVCSEDIDKHFLCYWLDSDELKKQTMTSLHGATMAHITKRIIENAIVSYPPLSEQQSIVEYLDSAFAKIDAMKANAEKALGEAKALFQASLKEMLEPKDGWNSMKLGDFAYMKAGDFVKASDIYQNYVEGLYPCYGGNGFRGYVNEPNQEGDFCLIGRQGALCGCINRAKGIFRTTEHAVIVKPYQDIPTSLVYYMLINLNLNKYATGAAQPGLSVKNIAEQVILPVPPRNAHFTIATTLDSLKSKVDQLQANYEKISKECDALKQAVLKQVFE